MTTKVLVFAGLRALLRSDTVSAKLREGATYADLLAHLTAEFPEAASLLEVSRIAAGGEFVSPESTIDPSREIAIIPPVSGG